MIRLLFLLGFVLFNCAAGKAQTLKFRYLSQADGLASNKAFMSVQDQEGFVWIATAGGINRYDGKILKTYDLHNIEGVRQRTNLEPFLAVDTAGAVWLALSSGTLLKYDEARDVFVLHDQIVNENGSPVPITGFTIGRDGVFAFAAFRGAFAYNPTTRVIIRLEEINATVKSILQSENRTWYVGTKDGIVTYDDQLKLTGDLKERVPAGTWLPQDQRIEAMYLQEDEGKLWIGSRTMGLHYYDLEYDELVRVNGPLGSTELTIRSIVEPIPGKLMIGTDGGGVFVYNTFSGEVEKQLTNLGTSGQSLNSNAVYDMMICEQGLVFISTFRGGINIVNLDSQPFHALRHERGNEHSLKDNVVYSMQEVRPGVISFGTDRGLSLYDKENESWTHLSLAPPSGEKKNEAVWSQTVDWNGDLLVSSYTYPMRRFTHRAGSYASAPLSPLAEAEGRVRYLHSFGDSILLFATVSNSLFTQKADGSAERYPLKASFDAVAYAKDRLIVGHRDGLSWLDLNRGSSAPLAEPLLQATLRGMALSALLLDEDRQLWVGTVGHGIFVFSPGFTEVRQIGERQGLASDRVIDLVSDAVGGVWVATARGLTRCKGETLTNYYESDGLISTEFNRNSALRDAEGRLYFGSNHGVITFDPTEIQPAKISKKLVLTDFYLNHKRIIFGEPNEVLDVPLQRTAEINLAHHQNSFSIGFTGIDFVHPDRGEYRWQLEGFDDDWIAIDGQNRATYTNLNPGKYSFRLRLTDPQGNLLTEERSLLLNIRSPWWATAWAYILWGLLAAGLLVLLSHFNRLRLESRSARERLHYLIELAHDIKTPLTLIKAPLTDLLNNTKTDDQTRESLGVALDSANLLQKQMRQFLDFQIVQLRKHQLELETVDVVELIRSKVRSFSVLAARKRIGLHFDPVETELLILSDENIVDKVISNLLSNAIKYTPEGGEVNLALVNREGYCEVQVRDTGIGVPRELQKKIFTLFYRTENARASGSTGSGVGLVLARDLAEALGGEVRLAESDDRGSVFVLRLPLPSEPLTARLSSECSTQEPSGGHATTKKSSPLSLLIVEDNAALRTYQARHFGRKFHVLTAENGEKALKIIGKRLPDVILSDAAMPVMNGFQLCLHLKSDMATSHIPFIMLTGQDSREHVREGFASGADDYIAKPVDFEVLGAKIDNLLLTREAFRKTFSEVEEAEMFERLSNDLDQEFLDKITRLVEENISDSDLSVAFLCQSVGMSRTSFYHKLKTLIDHTPSEFIRTIRLRKARQMLTRPGLNISEVAYSTGFSDAKYFSTLFKKNFGLSPSQFIAGKVQQVE